ARGVRRRVHSRLRQRRSTGWRGDRGRRARPRPARRLAATPV
ncbi:MAG: Mg/Co/Ni transporter MgtE, CBS domain-containing, partial [uncultured Acidimicrobiales bacterium]